MAFDRDSTLKQGEKFLRQGRLDAAIAEYLCVVEAQPRDWNTANLLGDLYFRVGQPDQALSYYHRIADQLTREGFQPKASALHRKILRLSPGDRHARIMLARAAITAGDVLGARAYLDRETAGSDPVLLVALVEIELRSGEIESARALIAQLLAGDAGSADSLLAIAWALADTEPAAAYACVEAVTDVRIAAADWASAAAHLESFAARCPGHIPALLKLVEVCVDGALRHALLMAQALLADAYLDHGHAVEARFIAEDLLAGAPEDEAHLGRCRRALVMLDVPDPDAHIAERLAGQVPFLAGEPFLDLSTDDEPAAVLPTPSTTIAPDTRGGAIKPLSPQPPGLDDEIDLTEALMDVDDTPAGMNDVFAGIRAGAGTEAEFAEQYIKLARKYVEMGMIDQAIESLTTASRSPAHQFEAATALGRLYMRQSEPALAIQWLEHAAEALAPTTHDGRALLYDLGMLLDATGDSARALAIFDDLQADAGDFHDVRSRIAHLARSASGG